MLFVFPYHLLRIQKDLGGSPEMDAMLMKLIRSLSSSYSKEAFVRSISKKLKHKRLLPVPLYTDVMHFAIQFVLQIEMITKMQMGDKNK